MLDAAPPTALTKPPLAVDLDGTLIRGDVFVEALLRLAFKQPWRLPEFAFWALRGFGYAKARVAQLYPTQAETLPYDTRLLSWLKQERGSGRVLALATASDETAARAVADHLGIFDKVFASDGRTNLKAQRKADALAAAYPGGFAYAGNAAADMSVWKAATSAIVVNAPASLARAAAQRFAVEKTFEPAHDAARGLVKAMRPQQWTKNLLVFLPMLVGQGWLDASAWRLAMLAFIGLSFTASGLYLVNDLADIDADRRHPRKCRRPFASGAVTPALGLVAAAGLLGAGLILGDLGNALVPLIVYGTIAALYTFVLKRITLIDVFVLAGLYTLRIVLGGAATGFPASDWLLAFSGFFFLSLALVKRAAEVDVMRSDLVGRGYRASDGPMLKRIGVSAGMIGALVLALYLQEPAKITHYAAPAFLWALPAAVVFWLSRVWLKLDRDEMHDDPLTFAIKDPVSWAVGGFVTLAFAAAVLW